MEYKILDKISVINYLLELPEIVEFYNTTKIEAKEIGDGNLNFVYLVSSIEDKSKAY